MLYEPSEPVESEQVEDVNGLQVVLLATGSLEHLAQVAVEVLQPCVVLLELCEAMCLEVEEGAGLVVGAWVTRDYARPQVGLLRAGAPVQSCTRWPGGGASA